MVPDPIVLIFKPIGGGNGTCWDHSEEWRLIESCWMKGIGADNGVAPLNWVRYCVNGSASSK